MHRLRILAKGIFILLIKLSQNVNTFRNFPPRRKDRQDWFKFTVNHNFRSIWERRYCELSHGDVSIIGGKTQG